MLFVYSLSNLFKFAFHKFHHSFPTCPKFACQLQNACCDTAIHGVLRKLKLSAGYGFKAVEAPKQPCALSVSNAQTYLISSPHFAWTFFHLLHMDGCSTVKLSPNGTDALQCPGQSLWRGREKTKQLKTLTDQLDFVELKACIFNNKHFLFKAVSTLCCWQIRLCFPSPLLIKCGFFSLVLSGFGWRQKILASKKKQRGGRWGVRDGDRHESSPLSHFIITLNLAMGNYQAILIKLGFVAVDN